MPINVTILLGALTPQTKENGGLLNWNARSRAGEKVNVCMWAEKRDLSQIEELERARLVQALLDGTRNFISDFQMSRENWMPLITLDAGSETGTGKYTIKVISGVDDFGESDIFLSLEVSRNGVSAAMLQVEVGIDIEDETPG
jgi:hypothetical protein